MIYLFSSDSSNIWYPKGYISYSKQYPKGYFIFLITWSCITDNCLIIVDFINLIPQIYTYFSLGSRCFIINKYWMHNICRIVQLREDGYGNWYQLKLTVTLDVRLVFLIKGRRSWTRIYCYQFYDWPKKCVCNASVNIIRIKPSFSFIKQNVAVGLTDRSCALTTLIVIQLFEI